MTQSLLTETESSAPKNGPSFLKRLFYHKWMYLPALAFAFVVYSANLQTNPPGFFVDESSIAFNAYSISQSGTDEYGTKWPLYFPAFGEYKNPTYIYLLAAVFKVTGPGIVAARLFSAVLGFAAALVLGLLAFELSGSRPIGAFVAASALATPWLFEISRLVFEVALYPLLLACFLLVLARASSKEKWSALDSLLIALLLALLSYSYSIGRLLAPLLAIGLIFFVSRRTWRGIIYAWFAYIVTLIPLFVFNHQNSEALFERFNSISYIWQDGSLSKKASQFIGHYFANLNLWNFLLTGDSSRLHHVGGMGSILAATAILAIGGIALVLYRHRGDPWWRFVLYGLAVSVIPASLTRDDLHALRLIPVPVFLLLLMVPALERIARSNKIGLGRRKILITLIGLALLQAVSFQLLFHRRGPDRILEFEAEYPKVFNYAVSGKARPIYLVGSRYVHAYWYAVLEGIDSAEFKRQHHPPPGSLAIRFEPDRKIDQVLIREGPFVAYIVSGE